MPVKLTQKDKQDLFNMGYTNADVMATIAYLRNQGLTDTDIQNKFKTKIDKVSKMSFDERYQLVQKSNLTKEAKVQAINNIAKQQNKANAIDAAKGYGRIGAGALLSGAAAGIPVTKFPVLGTALGGAMGGAGEAIMRGKSGKDILKDAGTGAVIGATLGAAGKGVSKAMAKKAAAKTSEKVVSKTTVKPQTVNKPNPVQNPVRKTNKPKQQVQQPKPQTEQQTQIDFGSSKNTGEKTNKFIKTVKESELASPKLKHGIDSKYTPITNKETMAEAQSIIDNDMQAAINNVLTNKNPKAIDIAMAEDLARRLQQTGNEADLDLAVSIIEKTAQDLTEAGRTAQAAAMWQRLTPEGALLSYQKAINKNIPDQVKTVIDKADDIINYVKENAKTRSEAEELLRNKLSEIAPNYKNQILGELKKAYKDGNFDKEHLLDAVKNKFKIKDITKADVDEFKQLSEAITTATDKRTRDIATAKLKRKIEEVTPVSLGRKISTVQAAAQLINPKTIIRNLGGNTLYGGVEDVTQSIIGAPIDKLYSLFTKERSVMPTNLNTQLKGLGQGLKEGIEDIVNGIDTAPNAGKYDLWSGRTFRDGGVGAVLENLMNLGLRVPDRAAYTAVYNEAVENMLRAKGIKNITKEMLENPPEEIASQANLEALQRTFQDNSYLAESAKDIKNILNAKQDFGLGDVVLKYAKTPANIMSRMVDYSPIGLGKGLWNTFAPAINKTLPFNQRQAVMDVSRGLMGSGLTGLGIALANNNNITGAAEDKEKYQANLWAQGKRPYSFLGDDKAYSYDWAVPMSSTIAAGANYKQAGDIVSGILSSAEPLAEQPLMQGLKMVLGNNYKDVPQSLVETAINAPLSFIPSVVRQTAQTIDPYYRETKVNRDVNDKMGLPKAMIDTAINKAKAQIPGLSMTLAPKYDVTGQPVSRGDDVTERFIQAFLNPANVSNIPNNDSLDKSVELYENAANDDYLRTKANRALYSQAPDFITENGQKRVLTPEERSTYQRDLGQITQNVRDNMFSDAEFNNKTDEQKLDEMNMYNNAVNNAVKYVLFGIEPTKYKSLTEDIKGNYKDYIKE